MSSNIRRYQYARCYASDHRLGRDSGQWICAMWPPMQHMCRPHPCFHASWTRAAGGPAPRHRIDAPPLLRIFAPYEGERMSAPRLGRHDLWTLCSQCWPSPVMLAPEFSHATASKQSPSAERLAHLLHDLLSSEPGRVAHDPCELLKVNGAAAVGVHGADNDLKLLLRHPHVEPPARGPE
jgi:hypothetical protein